MSGGGDSTEFSDFAILFKNMNGAEAKVGQLNTAGEAKDSGGVGTALKSLVVGLPAGGLGKWETEGGKMFINTGKGGVRNRDTMEEGLGPFVECQRGGR